MVRSRKMIEYQGKLFSSLGEIERFYGLTVGTLRHRLRKGMSLDEAVTTPIRSPKELKNNSKSITDHKGITFPSITDLAKHYGLPRGLVCQRISSGLPMEEVVRKPDSLHYNSVTLDGKCFNSYKDIEEFYKLPVGCLSKRLKKGMSLEDAVRFGKRNRLDNINKPIVVTDYLGNKFNSLSDMARFYGLTSSVLNGRLKRGWGLKKALLQPIRGKKSKKI